MIFLKSAHKRYRYGEVNNNLFTGLIYSGNTNVVTYLISHYTKVDNVYQMGVFNIHWRIINERIPIKFKEYCLSNLWLLDLQELKNGFGRITL